MGGCRRIENTLPALDWRRAGKGAEWVPFAEVLNENDDAGWGAQQKGALKSFLVGRQWTQQRVHSAGLLCLDMDGGRQIGTLMHRHV